MSNRTIRTVAACLLLPLCLVAQESVGQDGRPMPARQSDPLMIVTMAFPGGTVPQFVAALQKVQPEANIVLASRADEAVVPALELRGTDIDQALETACLIAEGAVEVRVKRIGGRGRAVHMILAREIKVPQAGVTAAGEVTQSVFTLNQLTMRRPTVAVEPLAVETILSAVELVTTVDGKGPVLRYHKDSGLLLVRGTDQQVNDAANALAVMGSDLDARELYAQQRGLTVPKAATKPEETR